MGRKRIENRSNNATDTFNLLLRDGYRDKIEALAAQYSVSQTQAIHDAIDRHNGEEDFVGTGDALLIPSIRLKRYIPSFQHIDFNSELKTSKLVCIHAYYLEKFLLTFDHAEALLERRERADFTTVVVYDASAEVWFPRYIPWLSKQSDKRFMALEVEDLQLPKFCFLTDSSLYISIDELETGGKVQGFEWKRDTLPNGLYWHYRLTFNEHVEPFFEIVEDRPHSTPDAL